MSLMKSLFVAAMVVGLSACGVCQTRQSVSSDVSACIKNQMSALESGLSSEISAKKVKVEEGKGGTLMVDVSSDAGFVSGSSNLNASAEALFGKIGKELAKCDRTVIHVVGHTDSKGKPENNQALSERRATAVAAVLVKNGVPRRSIKKEGRGERDPVASNDTDEGKRANRRVDIVVSP